MEMISLCDKHTMMHNIHKERALIPIPEKTHQIRLCRSGMLDFNMYSNFGCEQKFQIVHCVHQCSSIHVQY